MKDQPLVSVVIPTYNRAYILRQAIDSVLNQTYANCEVIVVDDGSADETQHLLRSYGVRIRVLTQRNSGPSIARNRGIAAATGSIVAFLDSDDYWLPTKIARQVEVLSRAGDSCPCCICNCSIVYNDGTRGSTFAVADTLPPYPTALRLNPAEVLTTRFVIFSQAVAIRRGFLERVGAYDENLPFFCEDHELALRLALAGPWAIIRDELVVCQDGGPGSLGQRALREEVRLRTDLVYMRNRIACLVENSPSGGNLRKLARREVKGARRALVAARLASRGHGGAAVLSRSMRFVERVRRAVFRRSSSYPRVIATQIP
jgi:glycosyltransferase involved in cell wall biosynthesis